MSETRSSISKGIISELDGLRGIAILVVMAHRFWPRSDQGLAAGLAGAGWIGVDLFFVISGFLIGGILLDTRGETDSLRNFYARRVLRIFPLYYLFVGGVLLAFSSNPAFREQAGAPVWYLLHLGNVPEGILGNDVPYFLGPIWSLAIEEQFYLTYPWLVHVLDRRRLAVVLLAMLAVAPILRLLTMLAYPSRERIQYLVTFCRLDTVAVGCLLAIAVRSLDVERTRARIVRLARGLLASACVIALASGLDRATVFGRTLGYSVVALGCASVVTLVVLSRGEASTHALRWPWLRYFGKLCFGIYLLHRPADTLVSTAAAWMGLAGSELWLIPVKVVAAVVLASVSWFLLERPFMALKDRFSSSRHPTTLVVALVALVALGSACDPRQGAKVEAVVLDARGSADPSDALSNVPDAAPDSGSVDALTVDGSHIDAPSDAPPLMADAPPLMADAPPLMADAPPLMADAPPLMADAPPPPLVVDASPLVEDASPPPLDASPPLLVVDAPSPPALPVDAPPDSPPAAAIILYPEGRRHSPMPPMIAARLQAIAASVPRSERVFAKVGDSNTAASSFLRCFDGGAVELGASSGLVDTLDYYLHGDAGGTSPYLRTSVAAVGGTTVQDVITGSPHRFAQEVVAIDPRVAVIMFGTNDVREGRSYDAFGADLWTLVDEALVRGVIPVLSSIPPINGDPGTDRRIPTFNRIIRAIAQGRRVPFIDLHRELVPLPNRGLLADGLHLTQDALGPCVLTSTGLRSGHNLRNLSTLEALDRIRSALAGTAPDAAVTTRTGTGHIADPFLATLPAVDLGDVRGGDALMSSYGCGAPLQAGRELVYRLDMSTSVTLAASVVDRGSVDVSVHILVGAADPSACVAWGERDAVAVVGPGPVYIVVDTATTSVEGEFVLVVEAR